MNEASFQFDREDYLDFLCANYYDLRLFCLDYDLILPISEDLGFIRDYLDANLLKVIRNYYNGLKEKENNYAAHN